LRKEFDFVLLTDRRYLARNPQSPYISNIFAEDDLLIAAFEKQNKKVCRINWDNPEFDWSTTEHVLFRTTWDYFERIDEFRNWMVIASSQTKFINSYELISWNLNKKYLKELNQKGLAIPPTLFLEPGENRTLFEIAQSTNWKRFILKPAISGAAWHTYLFQPNEAEGLEPIFQNLISGESMLLQEFQENIQTKGEISMMVIGGKFTHSILKKAKQGDFRVQDDFGGTVHSYAATKTEIDFAEQAVQCCKELPAYARVDVLWDNQNQLCLGELEIIEPEMWFRNFPKAAEKLVDFLCRAK